VSESPSPIQHPTWQVQMMRNSEGAYDIGLVLAGRSHQLTWSEATTLSVALKVAVECATSPEDHVGVDDAAGTPAPFEDP